MTTGKNYLLTSAIGYMYIFFFLYKSHWRFSSLSKNQILNLANPFFKIIYLFSFALISALYFLPSTFLGFTFCSFANFL